MLKIAICDDEEKERKKIESILNNFALKYDVDIKIISYSSGNNLLSDKKEFDLIFLDVEMDDINGIETAEKIRATDMNVPIVYITNYSDYWKRAYKVHAFDFISKPYEYEDIENVLRDFLVSLEEKNENKVSFTTDDGLTVFNTNSIIYFHLSAKRCVQIFTIYKNYITKESLNSVMERLDNKQFYRTSREYIVNLNYVETILNNDGIVLKDNIWIPLALKKQSDFYKKLSEQLRQL